MARYSHFSLGCALFSNAALGPPGFGAPWVLAAVGNRRHLLRHQGCALVICAPTVSRVCSLLTVAVQPPQRYRSWGSPGGFGCRRKSCAGMYENSDRPGGAIVRYSSRILRAFSSRYCRPCLAVVVPAGGRGVVVMIVRTGGGGARRRVVVVNAGGALARNSSVLTTTTWLAPRWSKCHRRPAPAATFFVSAVILLVRRPRASTCPRCFCSSRF